MREIRIVGQSGGAVVGAPLQAEALAYFKRMTTPPSAAFRDAVNWAIWRWKAIGVWPLVKGLWIHAADAQQAALLSVIGDTPRDATILAAPTFVPLKGFTAFNATLGSINYPITAAILDNSTNIIPFVAAAWSPKLNGAVEQFDTFIRSDAGTDAKIAGNWALVNNGGGRGVSGGTLAPVFHMAAATTGRCVLGTKNGAVILGGSQGQFVQGGGALAPSSNYRVVAHAYNAIDRLSAYGFLASTATAEQGCKFLAVLAEMLDQLEAFD